MVELLVEPLVAIVPCSCIEDFSFALDSSAGGAMATTESSAGAAVAMIEFPAGTATALFGC
jgi:hypothetical protein